MRGIRAGCGRSYASARTLAALAIALALAPAGADGAGTAKETLKPLLQADSADRQPQDEAVAHGGERTRHAAAVAGRRASGLSKAPSCLPERLKTTLRQIERRWGPVEIISTHRPGARIRGSGKPSLHASCRAVDFRPPKGAYRAVASWLKKSHAGGVGTYSGHHNHIHIDARRCALEDCYRWHN